MASTITFCLFDNRTHVRYNRAEHARCVQTNVDRLVTFVGNKKSKRKQRQSNRQLDMAVATIQRRHGPRALIKGKPSRAFSSTSGVPHIPTGFPDLDHALGIGGLPKGRICELLGPATSGKTTLALKFLVQAQASGGQAIYIDQALYFDPDYAYRCGLDLSHLVVGTPHNLEEALAMTEALVRGGGFAAIVFDALDFLWTDPAATSPMAATLNRLPASLARSGAILLILHECPTGNSPALSTLAHHAAMRLHVTREGWISSRSTDIRGYKAGVEVLKNRLGSAGCKATIVIEFNGTVRGDGL
jgi:recombination protein RecA